MLLFFVWNELQAVRPGVDAAENRKLIRLPAPTLMKLLKMGGALARFAGRGKKGRD